MTTRPSRAVDDSAIEKIWTPEPRKRKADAVEAARLDDAEHPSTNSPA